MKGKKVKESEALKIFSEAFENCMNLLKLYDILRSNNKRAIKKSYAERIKGVLHIKAGEEIDRISNNSIYMVFKDIKHKSTLSSNNLAWLLRLSLILGVSSVDAYFHAIIAEYISSIWKSENHPKKLDNFKIELQDVNSFNTRGQGIRKIIQRKLDYISLQNPEKIKEHLHLIDIDDIWLKLTKHLGVRKDNFLKRWKNIIDRRDHIVHSADRHLTGPHKNREKKINVVYVKKSLEFIQSAINEIDKIIIEEIKDVKNERKKREKKKRNKKEAKNHSQSNDPYKDFDLFHGGI